MRHLQCARGVCLIFLVAGGARAADFRGDLTAGIGLGHDFAGLQLELGTGRWTGFASAGLVGSSSIALGGRWSARPDGSGFGLALQAAIWKTAGGSSPYADSRETITSVAATAHWRWRWRFLLIDLGAGPAVSFDSYRFPTYADEFDRTDDHKLIRGACVGILVDAASCAGSPFDVELGLGIAFQGTRSRAASQRSTSSGASRETPRRQSQLEGGASSALSFGSAAEQNGSRPALLKWCAALPRT